MNIRELVLCSIGVTSLSACVCGDLSFKDENKESIISAFNIIQIAESQNIEVGDVSCEQICETISYASVYEVTDCSMEIDYNLVEEVVASQEGSDSAAEDTSNANLIYQEVGTVTCSGEGERQCVGGRRPLGYQEQTGGYFARMAHLEASSVVAFQQLIEQFKKLNAPKEFVQRAQKAILDEKRHAAQIAMLARRYNEKLLNSLEIQEFSESLFDIALHNAIEGCIFETWAAVEAQIISQTARAEEIRKIYAGIAKDEIEHAQLSWDFHLWLMQTLGENEKSLIRKEQRKALARLSENMRVSFQKTPAILGLMMLENSLLVVERFAEKLAI